MRKWYEIKALDESKADISITDEIGVWGITAKDFISDLKNLKSSEITLSINSPGGSLFDGLAMFNALRNTKAKITTRVLGIAASAASLVAMAGDEIVMPENTFMMIHNPMGCGCGDANELRDIADLLDKFGSSVVSTYAARSGKTPEEIKTMLDDTTYMTAQEAVEQGFADRVEPASRITASFDVDGMPGPVMQAFKSAQNTQKPADNKPADGEGEGSEPSGGQGTPDIKDPEGSGTPPDTPTTSGTNTPEAFADQVLNLAKTAGMEGYASVWALATDDLNVVQNYITDAREITALCSLVNKADAAAGFIKDLTSVADVRAKLVEMRATEDDRVQIDTSRPADSVTNHQANMLSSTEIYARRRMSNPGQKEQK